NSGGKRIPGGGTCGREKQNGRSDQTLPQGYRTGSRGLPCPQQPGNALPEPPTKRRGTKAVCACDPDPSHRCCRLLQPRKRATTDGAVSRSGANGGRGPEQTAEFGVRKLPAGLAL